MKKIPSDVTGKTEQEARKQLQSEGFQMRVMNVDGKEYAGIANYRLDRVNVRMDKGVVTEVRGIG